MSSIYKFYNKNKEEIPAEDWNIIGLSEAMFYTKNNGDMHSVGGQIFFINSTLPEGITDKFYVYDNTSHEFSGIIITDGLSENKLYFGYLNIACNITDNYLGSGKVNTETILEKGTPHDFCPNIWDYILYCRNTKLNDCDDWYIGSTSELDMLRSSGLVEWFDTNYLWSSSECSNGSAQNSLDWDCDDKYWRDRSKDFPVSCVAIRSF